jgi:hypothetical protein
VSDVSKTKLTTIKCDSLTPIQHPTQLGLRKSCDYYEQRMLKYDDVCAFHSRAELYHAALLEGDPSVDYYVPQPYRFRIGKRIYVPDCYVVRNGQQFTLELKPRGEFNPGWLMALTQYCYLQNMSFEVVSNESIYAREQEAINWLEVIRLLVSCKDMDTQHQEQNLWKRLLTEQRIPLHALVDPMNRLNDFEAEVALFRLLHRGRVRAQLDKQILSYETEFTPCI